MPARGAKPAASAMPIQCCFMAASLPAWSWTFGCWFDPAQLKPPPQTENPLLVLDAHLLEGRPPIDDVAGEPRLEGGAPQHAVQSAGLETLDHGGRPQRGEDRPLERRMLAWGQAEGREKAVPVLHHHPGKAELGGGPDVPPQSGALRPEQRERA